MAVPAVDSPKNRVVNGGFTSATGGWTYIGPATHQTTGGLYGNGCARVQVTYFDPTTTEGAILQTIPLSRFITGRTYSLHYYLEASGAGTRLGSWSPIDVVVDPGDGSLPIITTHSAPSVAGTSDFIPWGLAPTIELTITGPGPVRVGFYVSQISTPATIDAKFWLVDEVIIYDTTALSPADAPTPLAAVNNGPGSPIACDCPPDVRFRSSHYTDICGILRRDEDLTLDHYGRIARKPLGDLDYDEESRDWPHRTEEPPPKP